MDESDPASVESDLTVEEIVFSCSVCQATVSEVYATVESNHGFHSGSSSEEGIVTKMWIASCSHVTCSKHLENGAVPFHPKDQQPQAPCPKCLKDNGDKGLKELYSIHGLEQGQYDPSIPEVWMRCPAVRLDDSNPGMEAVRFQYMALCHYGRQVRRHWKAALRKQSTMEASYSKERKARRRQQTELFELQGRMETLEKSETQLKKWEDRKPFITQCMNAFGDMSRDIEWMRGQLIQLGFDVPHRKYLPEKSDDPKSGRTYSELGKDRLATGLPSSLSATQPERSSSARKRKREDDLNTYADDHTEKLQSNRRSSRDLMPPPLPKVRPAPQAPPTNSQSIHRHSMYPQQQETQFFAGPEDRMSQPHPSQTQLGHYESSSAPYGYDPAQQRSQRQRHPMMQYEHQGQSSLHEPHNVEPERQNEQLNIHPRPGPFQSHDPLAFSQLSLQSPGPNRNQNRYLMERPTPVDSRNSSPPQHVFSRHLQEQMVLERQPVYPTEPLFGPNYPSSQPSRNSHMHNSQTINAGPAISNSQGTYGASPFFKRAYHDMRPEAMQRPPTRGNDVQMYSAAHNGSDRFPAVRPVGPRREVDSHRPSGSFPDTGYGSFARQQGYQARQTTASNGQSYMTFPQTPRNSQGFLRRPDRRPPPAHQSPPGVEPSLYNKRITLPPSANQNMLAQTRDRALSYIPGVRGVSSRSNFPPYQPQASAYDSSRPLFSASGRRSVQRYA